MPRKKKNVQQEVKIVIEEAPLEAGFVVIKKANKLLIMSSLGFFLFSLFVVDISVFAYKGVESSRIAAATEVEVEKEGGVPSTVNFTNEKSELSKVQTAAKFSNLTIGTIIGNIIQVMLGMIGVVFVILIIYSGFSWMTSAGEEEKIKSAQGHLRNAIIGAVVVIGAQIITYWVLYNITEAALPKMAPTKMDVPKTPIEGSDQEA